MTPRSAPFATLVVMLAGLCVPASAETRSFGIVSFDTIEVRGDTIVELVPGHRISARAEGTREAIETLTLEMEGRTLVISQALEGRYGPRRAEDGPARLTLTGQNVSGVVLRGSGQIVARGLRGPRVTVRLDGPGRIEAEVPAGVAVATRASGSGSITLRGRAQSLQAIVAGSAAVEAEQLAVRDLDVRAGGTGSSRFAASGRATIAALGEANVAVAGRPRCNVTNGGAGTVVCVGPPAPR